MTENARKVTLGLQDALERVLQLRTSGHYREALTMCTEIVEAVPEHGVSQHILGVLYADLGSLDKAIHHVEQAIATEPENAEFYNSLGILRRNSGERDEAMKLFRQALARAPDMAEANFNLGALCGETGEYADAIQLLGKAVSMRPSHWEAVRLLAAAHQHAGHIDDALQGYKNLLAEVPNDLKARAGLMALLPGVPDNRLPEWLYDQFLTWLRDTQVPPIDLVQVAWRLMILRQPSLLAFISDPELDEEALAAALRTGPLPAALKDPLLRVAFTRCLVPNLACEMLIGKVRRALLAEVSCDRPPQHNDLEWITPLALQAHGAGFVYVCDPTDQTRVDEITAQVEATLAAGDMPEPGILAVLALFIPLDSLLNVELLAGRPPEQWPAAFDILITRAVREPLRERELRSSVTSLGEVTDDVSLAVQAQYEEAPYPRWIMVNSVPPRPLAQVLSEYLRHATLPLALNGPVEILEAGCGTCCTVVEAALNYEGAQITGLDLSRASLSYGLRMVREMGLDNVTLIQGDILEVEKLGASYDYIGCGGVLHHMADPLAGWRALAGRLKPHGIMRIALYSRPARTPIAAARAVIAERGLAPTNENIREFRRFVIEQREYSELGALLQFGDFYYLSGCRDLIFNAQEHQLDVQYIESALDTLNFEFLGFQLPAPEIAGRYLQAFPTDRTMTNLGNWRRFEEDNPETFRSMYQFWCRPRAT